VSWTNAYQVHNAKINYTLKTMKNLHSELFCEKTLTLRNLQWLANCSIY